MRGEKGIAVFDISFFDLSAKECGLNRIGLGIPSDKVVLQMFGFYHYRFHSTNQQWVAVLLVLRSQSL